MISVISPSQFRTLPWKNGKGETIELAISPGGDLNDFEWRISIASVITDGIFSDFSGYDRNLVLIQGNGIALQHDQAKVDRLEQLLSLASFDGGSKTFGSLNQGPIKDLNLITNNKQYRAQIDTCTDHEALQLTPDTLCFIYGLTEPVQLMSSQNQVISLPCGSLMQISPSPQQMIVTGKNMVVMQLHRLG